jgi:hypothetical protein
MLPEIVRFTKTGGPLTKRIALDESGRLKSDGSACIMSHGEAWRTPVSSVGQLAALIGNLNPDQAIALGSLRPGLPDKVGIATKHALNGAAQVNIVARSAENIMFRSGQHGFVLIDFDTKGMPADIAERLKREGGCWPALLSIMPELAKIARVTRASTSAGLYRNDTGATLPGSNGLHIYLAVQDTADSGRFLKALHARCWLAGYGWMMVGAGGQLLERSIVDRMVGSSERLIFEGAPILVEPLAQSAQARQPSVVEGVWLDTKAACPPLNVLEKAELAELHAKAKQQLAGESAKAREEFIDRQADELAKRSGVSRRVAIETIRKQCSGILLPTIALPFDDPDLAGKTVADVLADPAAYEGETLADPLEGIDYGRGKAKIMRRADGTVWIHSFAHGRTTYELKLDAAAIRAAMSTADKGDVIAVMIELLLKADVDPPRGRCARRVRNRKDGGQASFDQALNQNSPRGPSRQTGRRSTRAPPRRTRRHQAHAACTGGRCTMATSHGRNQLRTQQIQGPHPTGPKHRRRRCLCPDDRGLRNSRVRISQRRQRHNERSAPPMGHQRHAGKRDRGDDRAPHRLRRSR